MPEDYDVVLLVEEQLTEDGARRVRSLHEALEEPVTYHLLMPLDDAAARIEASLGTLGSGDTAGPVVPLDPTDLQAVQDEARARSEEALQASTAALEAAGATVASGALVSGSPTDELADKVGAVDGREAIVMTRPHVVAELFHLDWTSRARRKLGVPVLHLLEHESFVEQSEEPGDGVTGF